MTSILEKIKGKLVVSCQALPDEPPHSPFIMSRMALAAQQGGAAAIRANSVQDTEAIMETVTLPVIALLKRDYPDSDVYITATKREVEELMQANPAMLALDATTNPRPGGLTLKELVAWTRQNWPQVKLMADIATAEEAVQAESLGFDCVGTTLHGYTQATQGKKLFDNDFAFLREIVQAVNIPVIAEGNVETPEMMARCLALGAYAVVVGGAITRPRQITQRFAAQLPSDS